MTKSRVVLLALAVLGGLVVWLIFSRQPEPATQKTNQIAEAPKTSAKRSAVGRAFSFEKTRTFSEFLSEVSNNPAAISPGQQVEYVRQLALFCENAKAPYTREQLTEEQSESIRFVEGYAQVFCNQQASFDELTSGLDQVDSRDDVVQAHGLLLLDDTGASPAAQKQAESLVVGSASPSAVEIAARYLLYVSKTDLQVAKDVPVPQSVTDKRQAQMLAIKKFNCQINGGCGPEGVFSVLECSSAMKCKPGITSSMIWTQAHSTDFLTYSDAVLQKLLQARRM